MTSKFFTLPELKPEVAGCTMNVFTKEAYMCYTLLNFAFSLCPEQSESSQDCKALVLSQQKGTNHPTHQETGIIKLITRISEYSYV